MKKLITKILIKDLFLSGSTQKAFLIQIRSPLVILDKIFIVEKPNATIQENLKNDLFFVKDILIPFLSQISNIGEISLSINRNLFLHAFFKTGTIYNSLFNESKSEFPLLLAEVTNEFKKVIAEKHKIYWSKNDVESHINDNNEWTDFKNEFPRKLEKFNENNNCLIVKNEPISLIVYFSLGKIDKTNLDVLYFRTDINQKGFLVLEEDYNFSSVINRVSKMLPLSKNEKAVYVFNEDLKQDVEEMMLQNNRLVCFKKEKEIFKKNNPDFSFENILNSSFLDINEKVAEKFEIEKEKDQKDEKYEVFIFVDKKKSKNHCIAAKMFLNGVEQSLIMNCFSKPHDGIFKSLTMLGLSKKENLLVNLAGIEVSSPMLINSESKRITSKDESGSTAKYNDFFVIYRDRSLIFEKLTKKEKKRMENINNFKVFNGDTFVYPELFKKVKKVNEEKINPKVDINENLDEKMKLVVEQLKSFENKKSCHNKVYFYLEEQKNSNAYRVHVISDVLSKHGNSRALNYENVYVISKEGFELSTLKELKNPLKLVNKLRATEVVIVFNDKNKALLAKKEKLSLNKQLFKKVLFDKERYLISFTSECQVSHNVCYEINKNKNSEFVDDREEFIVDESKTSEGTLCIYSDASFQSGKSLKEFTYGIVFKELNKKYMGRGYSSYVVSPDSSELNAIVSALNIVRDLKQKNEIDFEERVEIRCDCLNAVRFLNNDLNRQKLYRNEMLREVNDLEIAKIQYLLKQPELLNKVDFRWLKGHVNEKFNEMADLLAKEAYKEIKEINKVIEVV